MGDDDTTSCCKGNKGGTCGRRPTTHAPCLSPPTRPLAPSQNTHSLIRHNNSSGMAARLGERAGVA